MLFSEFESSNLFWHHVLAKVVLAKRLRFIVQSDSPDLLKGQSIILRLVRPGSPRSLSTSAQSATAVLLRLSCCSCATSAPAQSSRDTGHSDRDTECRLRIAIWSNSRAK